jgi:hypothetical protein
VENRAPGSDRQKASPGLQPHQAITPSGCHDAATLPKTPESRAWGGERAESCGCPDVGGVSDDDALLDFLRHMPPSFTAPGCSRIRLASIRLRPGRSRDHCGSARMTTVNSRPLALWRRQVSHRIRSSRIGFRDCNRPRTRGICSQGPEGRGWENRRPVQLA